MKTILRSEPVIAAIGALASGYLKFAYRTTRWTQIDKDKAALLFDGQPVILAFWHCLVPMAPVVWPEAYKPKLRVLVSQSADGEMITRTVAGLGIKAIRGSSQKKNDPAKTKGGMAAFREMARWMKNGGSIAITPDGPRGPAREMADGALMLARLTRAPVIMVGLASRPCIRAKTWDRTVFPRPFSRGVIVWDGPFHAEEEPDNARLGKLWSERLTAVLERAESAADGL
ncbi:MAG TPA: lysophospholipid acyltransferase family protein [Caulobacteraceae bacterium]